MKNGSKRRGGLWKAEKALKEKDGRNIDIDISKIRKKKTHNIFVLFFIHKCKMTSTSSYSEPVLVRR